MLILLFIAGLVLLFAGPWFTDQQTVGLILALATGIPLVVSTILSVVGVALFAKTQSRIGRRFF